MKACELPLAGLITNTEKDYIGHFADISDKNILCIGYSEDEIDELVLKYGPSNISMLTNWEGHKDSRVEKYPLVMGDITKRTHFEDDTFDAILTFSVLEHLPDLEGAAKEMARIVKNKGLLLHFFGPAWSCAYGHHLHANPGDRLLDFTQWSMPAHIHLLCDEAEILEYYLAEGYSYTDVASVMEWFYVTPLINRFYYDTYFDKFFDNFIIEEMQLMYNYLPVEHIKALQNKYYGVRNFDVFGGKYKLIVKK